MSEVFALGALHPVVGLVQMLGVGLLAAVGLSAWHTAWSLTRPSRRTYAWAVSRRVAGDPSELDPTRAYEVFTFRGRAFDLPAWRVAGDDPAGPVVVMTHGWGSSRVGGLKRLGPVLKHAREVVLWDLPGHGESPAGSRARLGADEHLDLLALLDVLSAGGAGDRVVLFGWSLGAGVSVRAAVESGGRHDIRGVICEAPYVDAPTPARGVIRLRGLPHTVNLPVAMAGLGVRLGVGPLWSGFARDRHASRLGGIPLTVVHGDADPVCPLADGRAIAEAAPNGRLVVIPGGGHNNLWTDPDLLVLTAAAVEAALRASGQRGDEEAGGELGVKEG